MNLEVVRNRHKEESSRGLSTWAIAPQDGVQRSRSWSRLWFVYACFREAMMREWPVTVRLKIVFVNVVLVGDRVDSSRIRP